jgi:hypothetical protein
VVSYLSDEWCALTVQMADAIQTRPGATVRMQYNITGTPRGDEFYYWVVDDGRLTDCGMGKLDDSEVTLLLEFDDAVMIQKDELGAEVAFMQGRMKVEGNLAKLMALLPVTSAPDYKAVMASLATQTNYEIS